MLNFRKLQFKHTPVPTELYTHTQSYSALRQLPKLLHPRSPAQSFPVILLSDLLPLIHSLDMVHLVKTGLFFFFTVGLETLEFHRPDSSMSDLTIETLCYIYPAPELVTVLFYFLT